VAEGKEWRDAYAIVMAVADVETLAINDLKVFARPVMVSWRVLKAAGEGTL